MSMIHLVDIEQQIQTQDSVTGEITIAWTAFKSGVFCDIAPLSVKDFIQSQSIQSDISVRIKLPYLTGLDASMRIIGKCGCHLDKVYNPKGFLEDPDTGQEYITVPCSQGVNAG